ncbi:C-X-C chemokine receptor type 2-like [Rhincodon typus]|uniref:C-X-C chemokine receptor type 2-like n=1 Tax=Rhincodon typus TaxID=259920 RepID=UPI0009A2B0D2|nr:C-X-C chemokine receptor type 2-like [Rhincodon typus]XP_048454501.1 C-X-C chemokine receptor type 2-like [Rhincodon typus]XP_048454502.1 C-X-C chemokine receptor type 2-like [Rhincodon typus]XP_048454503.1 C-X-C chemokine receptor type 2-like [Rhincodon typus]
MDSQKFELGDLDFDNIFEDYTNAYDYIIDPDVSPCHPEVNESINMALAVIYSLVCFLAVTGNIIVMIVLLHNRHTISSTDTYLLHLAVADLLFAVTLPFWAVDAVSGWMFGDAMCKIISMLQEINFYSGILLLACISIDRFLSIVYATQAHKQKRPFISQLVCAAVWLMAIVLSLPILYKGEFTPPGSKRQMCYEMLDGESAAIWRVTTRFLRHFIGFLIPLAVMVFCYSVTIQKLFQTKGFQKHKAMKIIIVVVLVFLICWFPHNIAVSFDTLMRSQLIAETCEKRNRIDQTLIGTRSLGFLHSCINPFVYGFIGVKFRRNLFKLLASKGIMKRSYDSQYTRSSSSSSSGV